jgi:glycosyltransferase involved in cell wall biosynthesis
MPSWSVVLPYYNETAYLRPTLDSLFGQGFRDFRLILVDNASTDGSGKLAKSIAAAHAEIETIHLHEPRPGKIHALQCGLARVETPFVTFCDADTFYPPHYLRRCDELFATAGKDVVAVMAMDLPTDHEGEAARRKRAKVMAVSRILSKQTHTGGFGQSFRTDVLREAGGFSADLWPFVLEDHEVMQRVFKFGTSRYAPDLWCIPSSRRTDRSKVGWTLSEQLLYHLTPFVLKDWFFYRFLKNRFAARALDNTKLREKSWT